MIYSELAIDYKEGFHIVDDLTNRVYTEEEARALPQRIKTRLVNRPKKIGCYVKELNEL